MLNSAFLSVFIEFLLLNFLLTLYHFLVDRYPCIIILKYNQTSGLFIFFLLNPFQPFLYFILLSYYVLTTAISNYKYAQ